MSPNNTPKRRYEFTCVASSYSAPGFSCQKGFKIILFEGDPKLSWFQNRSFEMRPLEAAIPPEAVTADKPEEDSEQNTLESLFSAKVVGALKAGGVETLEDAIGYTEEELGQISGVGPATIKKILEIAEAK